MRRTLIIAAALVLSLAARASAQAVELNIQSVGFEGSFFFMDIGIANPASLAGQRLGGIGIGATLSGNGLVHLQTNAPGMRLTGTQWASQIAPETYAWATFNDLSNAANSGGISGLTTFGHFDFDLTPHVPATGEIVARFVYGWDGLPLALGESITIHLSGDAGELQPYLFDQDRNPVYATVTNNGMVVPEPVSSALLLAGLASLAVRRRSLRTRRCA